MNLLTQRDLTRTVLERFNRQYDGKAIKQFMNGMLVEEVRKKLELLDLSTCYAATVDEVMGNDGWTTLTCDECARDVDRVIVFGEKMELCKDCLVEGLQRIGRS